MLADCHGLNRFVGWTWVATYCCAGRRARRSTGIGLHLNWIQRSKDQGVSGLFGFRFLFDIGKKKVVAGLLVVEVVYERHPVY